MTEGKSCSLCHLVLLGTRKDEHREKPSNQMIHLSFSICRTEWPVSCLLLNYWPCYTGTVDLSSEKHCLCCRQADVLPALGRIDAGEGCLGIFAFKQEHHYVVTCSITEKQKHTHPKKKNLRKSKMLTCTLNIEPTKASKPRAWNALVTAKGESPWFPCLWKSVMQKADRFLLSC